MADKKIDILDFDLNLPDGTGFSSKEVSVDFETMIRLCEERLPLVTSAPGFKQERLASKPKEPFRL